MGCKAFFHYDTPEVCEYYRFIQIHQALRSELPLAVAAGTRVLSASLADRDVDAFLHPNLGVTSSRCRGKSGEFASESSASASQQRRT